MKRNWMHPKWIVALALVLTACGGGGEGGESEEALRRISAAQNVTVYEGAGSLQCQGPGISPQDSSMKLIRAGIDVLRSGCGVQTNVFFPAVCGAATGEIVLHEIRGVNLEHAERQGFAPASELEDGSGRGYAWVDCDTGEILD